MQVIVCPDGHNITGTLERVYGTCDFAGTLRRDQRGNLVLPEYGGYTEIDWNSQETVTRRFESEGSHVPERIFICDIGDEIRETKLLSRNEWARRAVDDPEETAAHDAELAARHGAYHGRCPYPGCGGPADGSECRHPRDEDR